MNRSQLLQHIGSYLGITVVGSAFAALANLVVGDLLGPERYGIFAACMLVVVWGKQVHLGLFDAFFKQYPLEVGRKDQERADAIADSTFWGAIGLATPGIAIVVAASLLLPPLSMSYRIGLVITSLQLLPEILLQYSLMHARCDQRFSLVNRVTATQRMADALLKMLLTWWFGLPGLFAGSLLAVVVSLAVYFAVPGSRFGLRVRPAVVREMLVLGFPLFVIGMLGLLYTSVARPLVLLVYDSTVLGWYAMGQMFAGMLYLLPQAAQFVLGPTMIGAFGASGDASTLGKYTLRPSLALCVGILGLIAAGAVALDFLLTWVLEEFQPGIAIGKVLFVTVYFRAMIGLFEYLLIAVDDRKPMIVAQSVGIAVAAILALALAPFRLGGIEIALALAFGAALYAVWIIDHALRVHLKRTVGERVLFLGQLIVPLVATVAAGVGASWWLPLQHRAVGEDLARAAVQVVVSIVPLGIYALGLDRSLGLRREVLTLWRERRRG